MMTRMQRTALEKQSYVDAFYKSGLTQSAFCKQYDLAYQTFNKWLRESPKVHVLASNGPNPSVPETELNAAFLPIRCVIDDAHNKADCAVDLSAAQALAPLKTPNAVEATVPPTFCLRAKGFCLDVPLNLSMDRGLPAIRSVIEILHALSGSGIQND